MESIKKKLNRFDYLKEVMWKKSKQTNYLKQNSKQPKPQKKIFVTYIKEKELISFRYKVFFKSIIKGDILIYRNMGKHEE